MVPDFEAVCQEDKLDMQRVEAFGQEATITLLPWLAPKYKIFIDAAAEHGVCAEKLNRAKDIHARIRVYIGIAHAVHMLYVEKLTGAELKHVVAKLKSLGMWSGLPAIIKKAFHDNQ